MGLDNDAEAGAEPASKRQALGPSAEQTARGFTEEDQEALALKATAFSDGRGRRQGLGFGS
eukprot:SAG31_NODE_9532_length_1263_cov_0.937285_2_plen_61_part_00